MHSLAATVLRDAAQCFQNARRSVYEGAELLYRIREESLFIGQFSSFKEYVEQECQLSAGYASKLLTAWEYYVVNGGVSPRNLVGVDAEKLYLATKLPTGSVQQRFVKACEWSRSDFRDELASSEGVDCAHPEDKRVIICGQCSKRVG